MSDSSVMSSMIASFPVDSIFSPFLRAVVPEYLAEASQPILTLARDREMTENLLLSVQRLNTVEGRTQGTCMPREVPSVV